MQTGNPQREMAASLKVCFFSSFFFFFFKAAPLSVSSLCKFQVHTSNCNQCSTQTAAVAPMAKSKSDRHQANDDGRISTPALMSSDARRQICGLFVVVVFSCIKALSHVSPPHFPIILDLILALVSFRIPLVLSSRPACFFHLFKGDQGCVIDGGRCTRQANSHSKMLDNIVLICCFYDYK